jgi:hypothetical protein
MLVHHISHAPTSHVYGTSPLSPLPISAITRRSSSACTSAAPKSKHTLEAHRLVRRVWRTVSVFGGGRLPTDARLLQVQVTLDAAHHLRADLARVA